MISKFKSRAISVLSVLLLTFTVSSCDLLSDGVNFIEIESAKKVNELLNKNIPPDMLVYEIDFDFSKSSSSFSFMKDGITIVYVDPENPDKLKAIDVDIKSGETIQNTYYERQDVPSSFKGYTPVEVDVTIMINAIVEAINLLYEEEEIQTNGLGYCNIKFGNTPADIVYRFKTQTKTGSTNSGRRTQVSYDEYSFKADAEGNIAID